MNVLIKFNTHVSQKSQQTRNAENIHIQKFCQASSKGAASDLCLLIAVVTSYLQFHFPQFLSLNILNRKFWKLQFISFKLYAILGSVMKSHAILPGM